LISGPYTWSGLGQLGSISGIEAAIGGNAPNVTFTLSGVDPALTSEVLDSSDNVRGRDVTVYLQMMTEAGLPADDPYVIWVGVMDLIKIKATGTSLRTITLTAETLFTRRGLAPFGYLSDNDQQALYPGDRGLERIPLMPTKQVIWPSW
jgi:hypothetical protein